MLIISVILSAFLSASLAEKVPVDVYYESLCPDSKAFLVNELGPLLETSFKNQIAINLNPFGKSNVSSDGNNTYTCPRGPGECYGDKVHACALKNQKISEDQKIKFIVCTMKNSNKQTTEQTYPSEQCFKESNITASEDLTNCFNATESDVIFKEFIDNAKKISPPITSVPYVTVNKNETLAESKAKDLKEKVCSLLNNSPDECKESPKGAASFTSVSFIALVTGVLVSNFV